MSGREMIDGDEVGGQVLQAHSCEGCDRHSTTPQSAIHRQSTGMCLVKCYKKSAKMRGSFSPRTVEDSSVFVEILHRVRLSHESMRHTLVCLACNVGGWRPAAVCHTNLNKY